MFVAISKLELGNVFTYQGMKYKLDNSCWIGDIVLKNGHYVLEILRMNHM